MTGRRGQKQRPQHQPKKNHLGLTRPRDDTRRLWNAEQARLAALRVDHDQFDGWRVDESGQVHGLTRIAGVDLSFFPDARHAVAAVVVLSFPGLEVVDERYGTVEVTVPYVPGYLAFREVPPLAEMLRKLDGTPNSPQLLFVDGNGAFHPRRCGCASHLGIIANKPTIGIAKDVMQVGSLGIRKAEGIIRTLKPGEWADFAEEGEPALAVLLRPTVGQKTLVVSQGHRIGLNSAARLAAAACRHAVAEPIRQADIRSRKAVTDWLAGTHVPTAMAEPRTRRKRQDTDDDQTEGEHGDAVAAMAINQLLKVHTPPQDASGKPGKRQLVWIPKAPGSTVGAAVAAAGVTTVASAAAATVESPASIGSTTASSEMPTEEAARSDEEDDQGFSSREDCCSLEGFWCLVRRVLLGPS